MKKYVKPHAVVEEIIEEYPILKKFLYENTLIFSSTLINNYFGYKSSLTSKFINKLLTELDKRGELDEKN